MESDDVITASGEMFLLRFDGKVNSEVLLDKIRDIKFISDAQGISFFFVNCTSQKSKCE